MHAEILIIAGKRREIVRKTLFVMNGSWTEVRRFGKSTFTLYADTREEMAETLNMIDLNFDVANLNARMASVNV